MPAEPDTLTDAAFALPPRTTWAPGFADVVIHTTVKDRDRHQSYAAAKSGQSEAALSLARDLLSTARLDDLRDIVARQTNHPILLPVTALETTGFNAIPDAMARVVALRLGWPVSSGDIAQSNTVGHTRAKSFNRFVTPATFEGRAVSGGHYVLVDDHVGLGGTLANLKGYLETSGGIVIAMTTLTESRDGRQIALREESLSVLRSQYGQPLEAYWNTEFGHGLDCLTDVEARILGREPSLDAITDRLAQAAIEARGRGLDPVFRG